VAQARHKRDTDARSFGLKQRINSITSRAVRPSRVVLVAAPVAVVATAAAVTAGVASAGSGSKPVAAADISKVAPRPAPTTTAPPSPAPVVKRVTVSRSQPRRTPTPTPPPTTGKPRWTTTVLNLWLQPGDGAKQDGVLDEGKKVLDTGRAQSGRVEILVDGKARWVTSGYLADEKPKPQPAGLSDAPCPDMSVEDGLKPQTIKVYRAVCHAFPQVTEYGGWAPRTEHDTGNAIDVMVYGNKELGDEIADWAQSHAAEFDLYDLIWYDRIWTPVRSSEGWRDYGDHGSATANHMDHVHIGTN
jgi:hypothetical protein